jgi:hypothetical protein
MTRSSSTRVTATVLKVAVRGPMKRQGLVAVLRARTATAGTAAAVALLVLSSCGGTAEPSDVAKDFFSALTKGDAAKACSLSTKHLQEKLVYAGEQALPTDKQPIGGHLPCEKALAGLLGPGDAALVPRAPVTKDTTIDGENAHVTLEGTNRTVRVALTKVDGDWKVDDPGR